MKVIKHALIIYLSKRALKFDQMLKMYVEGEGFDFIYATGLMAVKKEKCLALIEKLL